MNQHFKNLKHKFLKSKNFQHDKKKFNIKQILQCINNLKVTK